MTACTSAAEPVKGNPDPGGVALQLLRTVRAAVPAGAQLLAGEQASEPRWSSCDGDAATGGWSDAAVSFDFRTDIALDAVVSGASSALADAGWTAAGVEETPLGPSATWRRTLADGRTAEAVLSRSTRSASADAYWDLTAFAPPVGRPARGC